MRREDAGDLALEKEGVARPIGGEREGAVESVRDFVGRIIIRIHCDWKKHKLIVGFVGNRQPNRLDIVFREILAEALPAFPLAKRAGAYGYSGGRFLLRPRDEACIGARVRIEPQRVKECCGRGGNANHKYRGKESTQPMALHVNAFSARPMDLSVLATRVEA